ncbi:MAG: ROK family protein [Candidatus Zixiibacteriota bacterium]
MDQAFAGIDLGGTNIKYGLCAEDGSILAFSTAPARAGEGPEKLLRRIRDCARELLSIASEKRLVVRHIGLGTPGTVDISTGEISGMAPNIPGWKGCRPGQYLESELGLPIHVENDANAMVLAEYLFGAAVGTSSVIAATVGTGIGGGIIIDSKLVRGATGAAAEFGHASIVLDGQLCACGKLGCLEAYAASGNLIRIAESMTRDAREKSILAAELRQIGNLTIETIFEALNESADPIAEAAVRKSADYLAAGLASIVTILNPEMVVIGGGIADAGGSKYIEIVRSGLLDRAIEPCARNLRVERAALGNKAGFIGAALLGEQI